MNAATSWDFTEVRNIKNQPFYKFYSNVRCIKAFKYVTHVFTPNIYLQQKHTKYVSSKYVGEKYWIRI